MVADDFRLRERFPEQGEHLPQHRLLHLSAIIHKGRAALIAHANTMCVIASHVAPFDCKRPRIVERAITADVEVVPRVLTKSTPLVITLQLLHRVALRRPRVGAMHHDQVNLPRCSLQFRMQP